MQPVIKGIWLRRSDKPIDRWLSNSQVGIFGRYPVSGMIRLWQLRRIWHETNHSCVTVGPSFSGESDLRFFNKGLADTGYLIGLTKRLSEKNRGGAQGTMLKFMAARSYGINPYSRCGRNMSIWKSWYLSYNTEIYHFTR